MSKHHKKYYKYFVLSGRMSEEDFYKALALRGTMPHEDFIAMMHEMYERNKGVMAV